MMRVIEGVEGALGNPEKGDRDDEKKSPATADPDPSLGNPR